MRIRCAWLRTTLWQYLIDQEGKIFVTGPAQATPHRRNVTLVTIWLAVAIAIGLVLAFGYVSVFRLMAEWQFAAFGRYFPAATTLLIVAVLLLPALIVGLAMRRRAKREEGDSLAEMTVLQKRNWQMKVLSFALAGLLGTLVIGQLVSLARLPDSAGERITVATDRLGPDFAYQGPASITGGQVRTDVVATIDDGVPFLLRTRRYAPVQVAGAGTTRPVALFVEVVPGAQEGNPLRAVSSGILTRRAIPREVIELYRKIGLAPAPETFVLYESARSMRSRNLFAMGAALVPGVFFLALGLWLRRRERGTRQFGQREAPATA